MAGGFQICGTAVENGNEAAAAPSRGVVVENGSAGAWFRSRHSG